MKILQIVILIGILLSIHFTLKANEAEGRSTIVGRVVDISTNQPLPGANVLITGTTIGTATDDEGRFQLRRIPSGRHTIRVSYLGYKQIEEDLSIGGGQTISRNFALQNDFIWVDDVVVLGILQGQARAFNQQKNAANIKNIISAEQLERFPDPNLAGALQRIPGVSSLHDRGEAGNIYIRGLAPGMSNVTINGERMATTGPEDRETFVAGISSEMVTSLEVIKAITPDMDADAVGGTVNLVTHRPVSDRRTLFGTVAVGYNQLAETNTDYRAAITYAERFGNANLLLNGTYSINNRASEDLRTEWGQQNFGGGAMTDVLERLRPTLHLIERERYGFSGQFDYQFDARNSFYIRGMANEYFDREDRLELDINIGNGKYSNQTTVSGARVERQGRTYSQNNRLYNVTLGGQSLIQNLMMNYSFGYSHGRYDEPIREYFNFRQTGVDLVYGISDRKFPTFSVTNAKDINDLNDYRFRYYEQRREDAVDNDYFVTLNFELPYSVGSNEGAIKFGGKYYAKDKEREHTRRRWTRFAGDLRMEEIGKTLDRDHINGKYRIGSIIDWEKGTRFWNENQALFTEDMNRTHANSHSNFYKASEDILAGYVMTTMAFDRFNILAGLRIERTNSTYTGNEVRFDESGDFAGVTQLSNSNDYFDFFPMIHVKYALSPLTNVRLAWTNTIARPNFIDLAPYEVIDFADETIARGNSELNPLRSMNIDLLVEHYFTNIGILSGGIYYKDIKDFVYTNRIIQRGGTYDGFRISRPENGESAVVYGFEAAWQQQLSFLPGLLSGLGIYANYTYTHSEAKLKGLENEKMELPRMVPTVLNLALTYQLAGFYAQVSINRQERMLYSPYEFSANGQDYHRYLDGHWQVDVSASQRLQRNVRLFMELNNLTNIPNHHYYGTNDYPYRSSFVSWWGAIGLRFDI